VSDHFVDANKMVGLDSTGRREAEDGGRTAQMMHEERRGSWWNREILWCFRTD